MDQTKIYLGMAFMGALFAWIALEYAYDAWQSFRRERRAASQDVTMASPLDRGLRVLHGTSQTAQSTIANA